MKLRKAKPQDSAAFIRIKQQLPMPTQNGETNIGGFLLGTDENTYKYFIENALCLVAETGNEVVGFGIILPDQIVKASDIWQRRNLADWQIPIEEFENKKIGYFEQLAFLPGFQRSSVFLAYSLANECFAQNNEAIFTTTVNKPVMNLAAVPFIKAAGGKKMGNINEHYENVGEINSDIYIIAKEDFKYYTEKLNLASEFNKRVAARI